MLLSANQMGTVMLKVFVFVAVGFLILVFYLWGQPYKRGFFCDDESLKHPFKDSTVTNVMLYIGGIGLPVITVSNYYNHLHTKFILGCRCVQTNFKIIGYYKIRCIMNVVGGILSLS